MVGRGGIPTRELLHRTVIRIRQDLARAAKLAEVLAVNQPTPPEVHQALQVLQDWTVELQRTSRPGPGRNRPATAATRTVPQPQPRRSAGPWPTYIEPGPLAARPRRRDGWRRRAP